MKKILLILLSFLSFFCFFSVVGASFFSEIFSGKDPEIEYCKGRDCGLTQGAEYIAEVGIDGLETEGTVSSYVQSILVYLLGFLKLLAVILVIYAGFVMLTAAGDEEKFKKGKTIIIFAIIGLIIIYLAGPIVSFVIGVFTEDS